jgi:pentatricopeptide repeat protein
MRQEGVNPNVVSFNAVLSACQRSGQWERALMLLDDMRQVIIPLYCCLIFVTVVIVVLVDII